MNHTLKLAGRTRIALGAMGLSGAYGKTDDAKSIELLHAALERGVTLFDTADFYGAGHNELLLGKALAGQRDRVHLSVKFGAQLTPGGLPSGFDGRPSSVKSALTYSLVRLGTDHVDVYRPARLDPTVPIEDTVGAIAELVKAGYVRAIGLSEVGPETIRRAAKVHPIADLQIEYSLASRDAEDAIFPTLHELGIGATLYGVLSRGLLSGSALGARPGDHRVHLPRFSSANKATNDALVGGLEALARTWNLSASQLAIGWVMARQPEFVPTLGIRTLAQLDEALRCRPLTAEQLNAVEAVVPRGAIAGSRYPSRHMAELDSEKK